MIKRKMSNNLISKSVNKNLPITHRCSYNDNYTLEISSEMNISLNELMDTLDEGIFKSNNGFVNFENSNKTKNIIDRSILRSYRFKRTILNFKKNLKSLSLLPF